MRQDNRKSSKAMSKFLLHIANARHMTALSDLQFVGLPKHFNSNLSAVYKWLPHGDHLSVRLSLSAVTISGDYRRLSEDSMFD